jgi:hypothetical protein
MDFETLQYNATKAATKLTQYHIQNPTQHKQISSSIF